MNDAQNLAILNQLLSTFYAQLFIYLFFFLNNFVSFVILDMRYPKASLGTFISCIITQVLAAWCAILVTDALIATGMINYLYAAQIACINVSIIAQLAWTAVVKVPPATARWLIFMPLALGIITLPIFHLLTWYGQL